MVALLARTPPPHEVVFFHRHYTDISLTILAQARPVVRRLR